MEVREKMKRQKHYERTQYVIEKKRADFSAPSMSMKSIDIAGRTQYVYEKTEVNHDRKLPKARFVARKLLDSNRFQEVQRGLRDVAAPTRPRAGERKKTKRYERTDQLIENKGTPLLKPTKLLKTGEMISLSNQINGNKDVTSFPDPEIRASSPSNRADGRNLGGFLRRAVDGCF